MSFLRRTATKRILTFLIGLAVWLGTRALAFPAMARIFQIWNLNADTYAYAPAWARFVADRSGEIIDIFALAVAVVVLIVLTRPKGAHVRVLSAALLAGAAAAALPLAILLFAGSARFPANYALYAPAAAVILVREALFCAFSALLIRQTVVGALADRHIAACAVSAVLQAALFIFELGKIDVTLLINGLLIGAAFSDLFLKTRSPFPEAAFAFAFRAISRVAFGYPNLGGAYVVSEEWLAGFSVGSLEGAGLITVLAAFLYAAGFAGKRKSRKR